MRYTHDSVWWKPSGTENNKDKDKLIKIKNYNVVLVVTKQESCDYRWCKVM